MAAKPTPIPPPRPRRLSAGNLAPGPHRRSQSVEGRARRGEGRGRADFLAALLYLQKMDTASGMLTHLTGAHLQSPSRGPTRPRTATRLGRRSLPRAILRPTTRQRSILDQGRRREGGGTGTPQGGQAPPRVTAPAISGPILRCPRSPTLLLATGPSWRWHRCLPGGAEIS